MPRRSGVLPVGPLAPAGQAYQSSVKTSSPHHSEESSSRSWEGTGGVGGRALLH